MKSGALCNAPVRRGVQGGLLSSDFELRRRQAPNCGIEGVQSKEMGREREGKSETPRRGPVKRKKPSELKRRGGQKRNRAGAQGPEGATPEFC